MNAVLVSVIAVEIVTAARCFALCRRRRELLWAVWSLLPFLLILRQVLVLAAARASGQPLPGGVAGLTAEVVISVGLLLATLFPEQAVPRTRTEEEAAHSLLRIFQASSDAMAISDPASGRILAVNEGFLAITGWGREEVLGRTTMDLDLWTDLADRDRLIGRVREQGEVVEMQVDLRNKAGEVRQCLISAALVRLEEQPRLLSISRDVTEHRETAEALRSSQRSFAAAFQGSPNLIVINTFPEGRVIEVNEAAERLTGFRRDDLLGRTTLDLELWGSLDDRRRMISTLAAEGSIRDMEFHYRTRDGELRPAILNSAVIEFQGEPCLISTAQDITERKRAEEALRASELKFATAFHASPDAISISTLDEGRYLEVNEGFVQLFGYRREEVIGRSAPEVAIWHDLEDRGRLLQALAIEGRVRSFEAEFRCRSGERRLAMLSVERIDLAGTACLLAVIRDVTDQKRAARERDAFVRELEAKNAELERFTYTVSHDLKSPLVTIRGFLGLLEKDAAAGDGERVRHDLERIRQATDVMRRLLDELLELSRVGRLVNPPETVDLAVLAHEAAALVDGQLRERGVEVVIGELPTVRGDRPRLREVFQNLFDNAVKFMGDQPRPRIEVGCHEGEDGRVVFVRDNGIGIDPPYLDKVFGLFERLDPSIDGTGIGLALVRRIVEVHGGRTWAESPGHGGGCTFCFTLPAAGDP